jgi:hypothetical protein
MWQGPEIMADVEESPIPVEFLNGRFRHVWSVCVVGRCHAEESLHVVDPGAFVGMFPPDSEVVNSSIRQ